MYETTEKAGREVLRAPRVPMQEKRPPTRLETSAILIIVALNGFYKGESVSLCVLSAVQGLLCLRRLLFVSTVKPSGSGDNPAPGGQSIEQAKHRCSGEKGGHVVWQLLLLI